MQLRIRIREQLCILVAVTSLLALMVLSLSIWISKTLSVSANLKATQVSQLLQLYKGLSLSVATRSALQKALGEYGDGNQTIASELELELTDALAGGVNDNLLLQAAIYPPNGPASQNQSAIVMVTGEQAMNQVPLPFYSSNGSRIYLGDADNGYPTELYPNLTWSAGSDNSTVVTCNKRTLDNSSAILLGPLFLDNSSAIMSMTIPIDSNNNPAEILGWLTVVLDSSLFYGVVANSTDLESAGEVLLVGPLATGNLFPPTVREEIVAGDTNIDVRFIFQPSIPSRHPKRATNPALPFPISAYPAVGDAYREADADSHLSSHNEAGQRISCGYAQVDSNIADWVVIFEASRDEVMAPINKLRNTILICIFSVFIAIIVICFPLAHYAVKPIRALKSATENSIMMYEAEVLDTSSGNTTDPESLKSSEKADAPILEKFRLARKPKMQRRRQFQIPERVPDRKHVVHNELTDLTTTFNEMSDELKVQYARLEDRVKKRTAELEKSRDLARAADESKTLFIANVSHELRTPLNGIIGMCSVAMQEDDISRVRQSLNIIYKSSDLLARLLNDLLTFSRNSYGQQLSIEHGNFRLGDIGTQIISIFEKQAREKEISLRVVFQGAKCTNTPDADDSPEDAIVANSDDGRMLMRADPKDLARGPADTGPLRDMTLLGDKNRILQVLMNLVSNSLKFTPEKGMVEVRVRCKGFVPEGFAELGDKDSGTTVVNASEPSDRATPPRHECRSLNFDFEVEDTGPGVPEHLQQEIFKPFVQGDLALSRKHGGTGLGLAICTQLAALMGGHIHLKSTLPDTHILIAEDNKVNQEVITRMLTLENVTNITLAEDGLEAVKQIRSHINSPSETNISLIFMDIQMPNMDGCEATKQIREMGFDAPIVALTAFDHETNRDACKSVGMNDFVGKPTFINTTSKPLEEVLYTFPLYDGVSVVGFRCTVKDKVLDGVVKEKQQARKDYKEAVERGETAGLLEQLPDASDVFTTKIGNVPANEKIFVEIVYLGELKHDAETDGSRFTVPTVIAPRYGTTSYDATNKLAEDSVNDSGGIRISVDVALDSSSIIRGLQSPSHPIAVTMGRTAAMAEDAFENNKASAALTLQTTELDKDFILVVISKDQGVPRALLETHPTIPHQRAVMATLVPKFNLPSISPEIVFVVDRSGSMQGNIPTLVAALKIFLKSLPANGVKFNICSFGSHFSFLFQQSKTYDESSLEEALKHVSKFAADFGGTEMFPAVEATCKKRYGDMPLEVMILTDGQIWNQNQLFEFINKQKNARFFSLGIGACASSALVEGIARAGNGFSQFVGENEKMDKRVVRMLKGALTPHIDDYTLTMKYADAGDEDFEMVEVSSVKTLVSDTAAEKTSLATDKQEKVISLFDDNTAEDSIQSVGRYDNLPTIPAPAVLQAPNRIPQLYPFQRTTVYLLLGPNSPQKTPKSVLLSATSEHGRLELEIPVEDIGHGLSVHQFATKKAVHELEQGRGWITEAKSGDQLLKTKYAGRWDLIVEHECVRLGTTFQVAGKYSSFVAVEKNNQAKAATYEMPTVSAKPSLFQTSRQRTAPGAPVPAGLVSLGSSSASGFSSSSNAYAYAPPPPPAPLLARGPAAPAPAASWDLASSPDVRSTGGASSSLFGSNTSVKGARNISVESRGSFGFGGLFGTSTSTESAKKSKSFFGGRGGGGATLFSKPAVVRGPSAADEDGRREVDDNDGEGEKQAAIRSRKEATDEEKMHRLIGLQRFDGSWTPSDLLWSLVGLGGSDVEKKLVVVGVSKTRNEAEVRATAIAIAWLEVVMAKEEETWEMVVDKARAWLGGAFDGDAGLAARLVDEAKNVVRV
ncbi:hypothetical protein DV737_g3449, partial [Chaetothyriales sp. CBS 132003]